MTQRDCIIRARDDGHLTPAKAQEFLDAYDGAFAQFQQRAGVTQAHILAAKHTAAQARILAAQRRRVAGLQSAASRTLLNRMAEYTDVRGNRSPGTFLSDLVEARHGARGETLVGKYEAVRRSFRRDMTVFAQKFRSNLLTMRRNKKLLNNVVREAFGENTKDPQARAIAQAWLAIAERARTRFNAAGGQIGKLAKWAMPQAHNSKAIRRAGFERWSKYIDGRLDWDEMAMRHNAGLPYSPEMRQTILNRAFEDIRTDGYSKRPASANAGRSVSKKGMDHRFFTFKNADAWMEYSAEFGTGKDAFRAMLGHLDGMAMDIAMMEVLGPNPHHMWQYLKDAATKLGQTLPGVGDGERATRLVKTADNKFSHFTGEANIPHSDTAARYASGTRAWLSSAQLGRAIYSAFSDFNTQQISASFAGASRFGFLKHLGKLITSKEFRAQANEAGLIFENAMDVGNAAQRWDMENFHVESAMRAADFTIRSTGLGWLTEVQRQTHGMHMMATAARDWHGKPFASLPAKTRRFLEGYGLGAEAWDGINRAPIHTMPNGLKILRAQEIDEAAGGRVADLWMELLTSSTEFAVVSADITSRAAILGKQRPGSIGGEVLRFGLQYKAHPLAMIVTHVGRIVRMALQGRKMDAAGYMAGLFIGNTLLGAVAMQLKEQAKGRDPMDMTTGKFWAAAILQGGGIGILGDFIFADQNRYGGSPVDTLLGPGAGLLKDALKFTVGNAQEALAGEDTGIGGEFVDLLRRYTPGGSAWYVGLIYEREILDRLQIALDPDAYDDFSRREASARERGTSYFSPPGSSVITGEGGARAPDFSNVMGER